MKKIIKTSALPEMANKGLKPKQQLTSRQKTDQQLLNWFKVVYTQYLEDNKGYINILDYLQGVFDCDKDYWAKIARKAGLKLIKREGIYFIKA